MSNILIQNGLLVDTEWKRRADILIKGSKIVKIAPKIDASKIEGKTTVVHADGLMVLPGLIDAHTHFHLVSRGTVTADSFKEGSRAASFGGITTVIDFADDNKESLKDSLDSRLKEMRDEMAIDFALHQGVYKYRESLDKELDDIVSSGVSTIKIFTTYKNVGYMIDNKDELLKVFKLCKEKNIMVSIHCEDDEIIQDTDATWKGDYKPSSHPDLRPATAEAEAIKKLGALAKEAGIALYVVHLSSLKGLEAARDLREEGVEVILETTPHYLFLNRTKLEGEDASLYIMTPPLREKEDNIALQEALCNGEIQVVATDHCSFTKDQKLESNDVRTIFPGIPGTEEMLPLIHTLVANGALLTINELVNLLSTGPAKHFGLYPQKGVLREGSDADIVIFDSERIWELNKDTIHSASGYTPYEGFSVVGKAVATYLRGRLIMGENVYLGIPGDSRFVKAEK